MFDLFNKKTSHLGLDFSDVSLKMIELDRSKKKVKAHSNVVLEKDSITGDIIKNPKDVIRVIKKAVEHPDFGKVSTREAVASVPETKAFVRVIELPMMSEDELYEAVPWEAEAYIPIPIGQVYLDWQAVSQKGDKIQVLISASPREYIDQFTEILKEAGVQPIAFEVESQATARSLVARSDYDKTILLVDISTARTSFIIFDRGTLHFTSSVPIAGNFLTQRIAQDMALNFEQAEELKKKIGLDEGEKNATVRKAMMPVLNNLIEEIRNTIRFYEEHSEERAVISQILLTGGTSRMKRLRAFINDQLIQSEKTNEHPLRSVPGIRIERGDPWVNILSNPDQRPLSEADSLSFATAIGLSLWGQ